MIIINTVESYIETIKRQNLDQPESRFKAIEELLRETIEKAKAKGEPIIIGGSGFDSLQVYPNGDIEHLRMAISLGHQFGRTRMI